jgi:uncharacterized protein
VIQGFFKLVFYIFIAYIIYIVIRFLFPPQRRARSTRPPQKLSGTMVKDETCNVYLPQEDAIREIIDGKEYFFCSKECRRKFLEQRKPAGSHPA